MKEEEDIVTYPPGPSLADIDLRLLRIFHVIVCSKGFSAAQYELQMSQSAISSHMKQLEERLGMRLCERGRSGFKLTGGGEVVYRALQNLFRSIDDFKADVADYKQQPSGDIYIAIDDATATNPKSPFMQMLRRLTIDAPQVDIHLSIAPPAELEIGVMEDRYHLIVAPFSDVADSLICHKIYEEREILYCGKGHPVFAKAAEIKSVSELNGMRYVERSFKDAAKNLVGADFERRAHASNMEVLIALLLTGEYIGYVPRHYAQLWANTGDLRPIGENTLSYKSHYHAVMRKTQEFPAALFALDCLTNPRISESPSA